MDDLCARSDGRLKESFFLFQCYTKKTYISVVIGHFQLEFFFSTDKEGFFFVAL